MLKNVIFIALAGILLVSCGKSTTNEAVSTTTKTEGLAVNLKKVAIDIEGMTCEIGCARTIQSKLSKAEGIMTAVVNFDEKEGVVEYDANKINKNKIAAIVEEIAGGDLYKVTGSKTVGTTSE